MGIIQISAAPEIIDMEDKINMGEVKDSSSCNWIKGLQFDGPQIVVNLNRIV